MTTHSEVFRDPKLFAGWPANYGMWSWGEEVLVIFLVGHLRTDEYLHARDKTRPFLPRQARSFDGGRTWKDEPFTGVLPGRPGLSGDEHVIPELQSEPAIVPERELRQLDTPVDFTDPETLVLLGRTGLHAGSLSWFYVSRDRGHSWQGPYRLGDFGQPGVSARHDIVPLGQHDALFLLSAAKQDGREGRVFAARTRDGGRSFTFESYVGDEPDGGYAIMPSSVRLTDGEVLTAVRCSSSTKYPDQSDMGRKAWIDLYGSRDEGATWTHITRPVPDTGYAGNPPTLTLLPDGRLVLVFGYRDPPHEMRAIVSDDGGRTWGTPMVLRSKGGSPDIGYPRTLRLADGALLSVYYFLDEPDGERYIAATRFEVPPAGSAA